MRLLGFTGILFFLMIGFYGFSQEDPVIIDPILVKLRGRILSSADSSAVPFANIINNRTHSGTITNIDGYFTLDMLNIDSLIVSSVGYMKKTIKIPYNYNGRETLVFTMEPVSYAVGEVDVFGDKPDLNLGLGTGNPVDIPPELRGDAFNEKPPALAALFNPVSYWQYYLSKREREKREVREAILLQKNWEMHSEHYNKKVVMLLTGLNESEADSFMVWFNAQGVLPYTATEYEVRSSIMYFFDIYKKEKMD